MSKGHPYKFAPERSFWSKAVNRGFQPETMFRAPLVEPGEAVVSAGSCFAANMVPYLESNGNKYVRTEYTNAIWRRIKPESFSYPAFSAAYGNIYTSRHLLQLLQRCLGRFEPVANVQNDGETFIDLLRPGLTYRASSPAEFKTLEKQHLEKTLHAFQQCDVFIFTLGLTEAWHSRIDGTTYPVCPGTVGGAFSSIEHGFINFNVAEVTGDLCEALSILREINPGVRVILTVSPVPLSATATRNHVVTSTMYSKSVLRVAAEEVCLRMREVSYFPSYEMVVGCHSSVDMFEPDRRSVKAEAVETVMRAFFATRADASFNSQRKATPPDQENSGVALLAKLGVAAECEEGTLDDGSGSN